MHVTGRVIIIMITSQHFLRHCRVYQTVIIRPITNYQLPSLLDHAYQLDQNVITVPASVYFFKVNNGNTRTMYETLVLILLLIYFVLTSIRTYNKNLHSCSFKVIQANIIKKYTKKLKCYNPK